MHVSAELPHLSTFYWVYLFPNYCNMKAKNLPEKKTGKEMIFYFTYPAGTRNNLNVQM